MEARHAQFDYHLSDFDFLNEGWKYEYLQTMYGEKHDGIWDGCDDNDAMEQAREGERKFCFYYAMRSGIPLENVQTHWDQISKRLQKHLGRLGVLLAREQKDERNSESLIAQRQKEIEKLERGLAKMDTLLSLCYGDYRQVLQNEVVQMIQEKTDHEKKIRELAKDKINKRIEEIASRMEVLKKALKGGEGWYYIEEEERKAIEKKLRGY